MYNIINETADWLLKRMPKHPKTAIILGTGLGNLADDITEKTTIPYTDIPHFPVSTVEGHSGMLVLGKLGNVDVIAMQGRFHFYEGYSMHEVTFPVRVFKAIGIETLYVSNAAGGMRDTFEIGDLMIIADHINHFPEHPLHGKNDNRLGTRFPDMSDAYSARLRKKAVEIAHRMGIKITEGVYLGTSGPTFETPAEYRYFKLIGADAVGMSTVPEVIVARHAGLEVFALSVITDLGIDGKIEEVSHTDVQNAALIAQPNMTALLRALINETEA